MDWQLSSNVKLKDFWKCCDAKQRADLVLVHKVCLTPPNILYF
jgi:hypothetical protein